MEDILHMSVRKQPSISVVDSILYVTTRLYKTTNRALIMVSVELQNLNSQIIPRSFRIILGTYCENQNLLTWMQIAKQGIHSARSPHSVKNKPRALQPGQRRQIELLPTCWYYLRIRIDPKIQNRKKKKKRAQSRKSIPPSSLDHSSPSHIRRNDSGSVDAFRQSVSSFQTPTASGPPG